MLRSAPVTKRSRDGAQQPVRCYVEVAGEYDGEEHVTGEFSYLDERHVWDRRHRRKVRVCMFEEVERFARLRRRRAPARAHGCGSRPTCRYRASRVRSFVWRFVE